MTTAYPAGLDSFTAVVGVSMGTATPEGRKHSGRHNDVEDAVEAIETELGVNPSGASASVVARLDALDAAWPAADAAHVAAADPHPQYETSAEAAAKVSAHAGASDPHGDRAYAAALVDDLSGVTNASTARTNLGLGDAATKNVGTAAGTVAAGDDSRITGALPASLVDAKGDLIAASADNTPARLPVGAEGDVLTVRGSAASGLAWAQPQPRNLLSVNQSSVETDTTGFRVAALCTLARSTAQAADGTASLLVTATGTGPIAATLDGVSAVPVVAGRLYFATASLLGGTALGRSASVGIRWYTAAGATIGSATFGTAITTSAAWQTMVRAEVAPATAAYAAVMIQSGNTVSGETFYVDKIGLWEGYGGTWALGGQPIQGVGERWDETVGRRCFRWNPLLNSGAGGEQMVYGDTGWRDVTASMTAIAGVTWSSAYLRRVGSRVDVAVRAVTTGTITSSAAYTVPSGFRYRYSLADSSWVGISGISATPVFGSLATVSGGSSLNFTASGASTLYVMASYHTDDAWPSTLPGSASGSIPSA